jgi:methyl-accepting chemotaxis protein PixJ
MNAQFEQAIQTYQEGRYQEAVQQFSELMQEHKNNPQLLVWMGAACREAGMVEEAKMHFQETLRLSNDPQITHTARTSLSKLVNSPAQAVMSGAPGGNNNPSGANNYMNLSEPEFSESIEKTAKNVPEFTRVSTVGESAPFQSIPTQPSTPAKPSKLKGLSLKTKATLLAITIGVFPVAAIGGVAYFVANQSITQEITVAKKALALGLADKASRYIFERYGDVQAMANLPILRNPKVAAVVSLQEKQALLSTFAAIYGSYDSVAAFDLNGNLTVQSQGKTVDNHFNRAYFQEVLKTKKPVISRPEKSKSTGKVVIHFAAPIFETGSGRMIGVIRSRMPIEKFNEVVKNFGTDGDEYLLADASGQIFLDSSEKTVGKDLQAVIPSLANLITTKTAGTLIAPAQGDRPEQFTAYAPSPQLEGLPNLKWDSVIDINTDIAFAAQKELLLILAAGTGIAAILVGLLATYLADQATRPVIMAADAVEKIGRGELATRVSVKGADELALLGSNVNLMAGQIQDLVKEQEASLVEIQASAEARRLDAEEQRAAKELLQTQLIELLMEVEGASRGDLTVRANVNAGEMGTVADFFNAIIESLRGIVTQVKSAAGELNVSLGENEGSLRQLAEDALQQSDEITRTLDSVQSMTLSIQEVAGSASQAAQVARTASATAEAGEIAMDRTVQGILNLRETIGDTAKKVKRLGESSQKISKAVSLINQIAEQTNLLSINASIEAARAGEEGRGFAVVAEEVGALAAQSAAATKEIEQIVESIQTETSEVVRAMEVGTTQVVEGSQLVEEAKKNLTQILQVSRQIDQLAQMISTATVSQAKTSQSVNMLMQDIAQTSNRTSDASRQVSGALQQTVQVAQQLQESVGAFKLNPEG